MEQRFKGEGPPLTPIKDSSYKGAEDQIAASVQRDAPGRARVCEERQKIHIFKYTHKRSLEIVSGVRV